jgi:hypothetical protein
MAPKTAQHQHLVIDEDSGALLSSTTLVASAATLEAETEEPCTPCAERAAEAQRLRTERMTREGFRSEAAPAPEDGEQTLPATWSGPIGVEGELTGDGRLILPDALRWDISEDSPAPLRFVSADVGAHQGAQVVGRILGVERREGGLIWGHGDFDLDSEVGREAARVVGKKLQDGVSMDLDDVAFEVRVAADAVAAMTGDGEGTLTLAAPDEDGRISIKEVAPDDEVMVTTDARIRAATIVAVPAFASARISLTASGAMPVTDLLGITLPKRWALTAAAATDVFGMGAGEVGELLLGQALEDGIVYEAGVRDDGAIIFDIATDFNWVDKVGGLPKKIRHIADKLIEKGKTEGHAIAIAVNAVKKGCATGDLNFPGVQDMNPGSRAEYCAAAAEWEAKKKAAKAAGATTETLADTATMDAPAGVAAPAGAPAQGVPVAAGGLHLPSESSQKRPDTYREVSDAERERLAKEGKAMPDGSFPVADVDDLKNAVQAAGRAKNPKDVHAFLKKRAKELDASDLIPGDWAALVASAGLLPFSYNPDQWRNPDDGKWIDMPDVALHKVLDAIGPTFGNEEGTNAVQIAQIAADNFNTSKEAKKDTGPIRAALGGLEVAFGGQDEDLDQDIAKANDAVSAYETGYIPEEQTDLTNPEETDIGADDAPDATLEEPAPSAPDAPEGWTQEADGIVDGDGWMVSNEHEGGFDLYDPAGLRIESYPTQEEAIAGRDAHKEGGTRGTDTSGDGSSAGEDDSSTTPAPDTTMPAAPDAGATDEDVQNLVSDLADRGIEITPEQAADAIEYYGDPDAALEEILTNGGYGAVTAAAPPVDPDLPPARFFSNPQLKGPTPLTVTDEGHVYGHLATWDTCHLSHTQLGRCVKPPRSRSGYAYFLTGAVRTAEGSEVAVGQITLDTRHADEAFNAKTTLAHYDHTGLAAADVSVGDDAYGIWFSGALRPGLTPKDVRVLRASPMSGDWRRMGTGMELVAALCVNVQGYPIPRPRGLVASGAMQTLVAAGMLAPRKVIKPGTPGALSTDDLRYLKRLAARERAEEAASKVDLLDRAAVLSRKLRASEMAARVASMSTTITDEGGQ